MQKNSYLLQPHLPHRYNKPSAQDPLGKATEIISHISHIRGLKVPDTEEQFQWLKEREQLLYKPVHHLIQRQSLHNNRENNNDITSG